MPDCSRIGKLRAECERRGLDLRMELGLPEGGVEVDHALALLRWIPEPCPEIDWIEACENDEIEIHFHQPDGDWNPARPLIRFSGEDVYFSSHRRTTRWFETKTDDDSIKKFLPRFLRHAATCGRAEPYLFYCP